MVIEEQRFQSKDKTFAIRSAQEGDGEALSALRLRIDGETEHMDREPGEAFIDAIGFEDLIARDTIKLRNLFLVAVADGKIVGYSRCEGSELKRFAHKVEFGVGVAQHYWGYGIGTRLLECSLGWADAQEVIKKVALTVLAANAKARALYEKAGFEVEGVLHNDRRHADGTYHDTIVMGRFRA